MKLIPDWHLKIWRHVLTALFWSAIGGLILVWPVLAEHLSVGAYIAGGVLISAIYGVAKILHRPGTE
jgi:hypothetical protein